MLEHLSLMPSQHPFHHLILCFWTRHYKYFLQLILAMLAASTLQDRQVLSRRLSLGHSFQEELKLFLAHIRLFL